MLARRQLLTTITLRHNPRQLRHELGVFGGGPAAIAPGVELEDGGMMDEAVDGGDRHGSVWKICPIQLAFQRPFEPKATLMITQRPIFAVEVWTSWHSGGSRPKAAAPEDAKRFRELPFNRPAALR
jgi:hypothetical protein